MKPKRIITVTLLVFLMALPFAACVEREKWTVEFMYDENTVHHTTYVNAGEILSLPSNPTKDNYIFDGWYKDAQLTAEWDFKSDTITANTKIYAKWTIKRFDISYTNTKSAQNPNPTTFAAQDNDINLAPLSLDGYLFMGWFDGDMEVTQIPQGTIGNLVLTAKWELLTYNIVYHNVDGVSNPTPTSYTIETDTIILKGVSKQGYDFGGWYTDKELTKKVTKIDKGTFGNIDLYAGLFVVNGFQSGTGTASDPYMIYTKNQFVHFLQNFDNAACYKLMANIDLDGSVLTERVEVFGVFDGSGFEISNFNIQANADMLDRVGLFSVVSGTVKNIKISRYTVTVNPISVSIAYAGGLVGHLFDNGMIINCSSGGDEIMIGRSDGTVKNCSVTGGGVLIDHNNKGTVENCFVTDGGVLVGSNSYGRIKNSFVTDGGVLVSHNDTSGRISNCYSTGGRYIETDDLWHIGGLVNNNYGIIENSYSTVNVSVRTGGDDIVIVGGLAGTNFGRIENCYATGNISGTGIHEVFVGGLVGENGGKILNCYATGNMMASSVHAIIEIGGLIGAEFIWAEDEVSSLYCYRYAGQVIQVFDGTTMTTVDGSYYGTKVDGADFATISFYTDTLGWDNEVWDFSGTLSYSSGPKLKAFAK